MTEQRDVGVRDVVVTDAAVAAIADVILAEQVLLVKIPFGAIGGGSPPCPPVSGQFVFLVRVDDLDDSAVQPFFGHVVKVEPGDLATVQLLDGVGGLGGAQIAAVAEERRDDA